MARPTTPINLTQEQSHLLQRMVRSRKAPHSLVPRAQMIRQAGQGINNKTISLNLGLCEDSVGLWRRRWVEGSVEQGVHVVSTDEKTGIQALERIHPSHPMKPGRPEAEGYIF